LADDRGPNLTLPILAHINFFHKNDQNLFSILNLKLSKKFDRPIFGWSAAMHLTKTARHMGPLLHEMANFFIKDTPFEFQFCTGNVLKTQNCSNLGRLADTPLCPKRPAL
jgi:hypothetical protein